jgi:phage terminase small subunit
MLKKLTPKQYKFIQEYCASGNATESAKRAGYSEKTAYSIGQENLNKPEIAAAIGKERQKHAERCAVTIESLTDKLNQVYDMAIVEKQASAAGTAVMGIAKLHGLIIDKAERKEVEEFAEVSEKRADPEAWATKHKPQLH